jgi:lysophospholipase L1-like esterase
MTIRNPLQTQAGADLSQKNRALFGGGSAANDTVALGDSITAQNIFYSTPSSFVVSGRTVTVSNTSHLQATGDMARVVGFTQNEFNGDFALTRIDANTFSYTLPVDPSTSTPSGTGRVYYRKLHSNNGYLTYANALLGGRLNITHIEGIPGERSDQIAARVGRVIALKPAHVPVLAGTNDFRNSSRSVDDVYGTCVNDIYTPLVGAGATVYAMSVPPLGATDTPANGLTVAQVNNNIVQFNARLSAYCAATPGMVFVPTHGAIVDTGSLTGVALAAHLEDQIHPSPRGAYAMGKALANAMRQNVKAWNNLPTSPADTQATFAASSNVAENPFLLAGTGGTVDAGVTEGSGAGTSVAQGWRVQKSGSATCTASLVARTEAADGDTLGNNQRLVLAFSANNDSAQIVPASPSALAARVTGGESIYAECAVKIANCPTTLKRFNLTLNYTVDGVSYSAAFGYGTASNNLQVEDGTYVFRTPVVRLPNGAVTSINPVLFIQSSGAASSFTVDVGRPVVRKAA